MEKKFKRKPYIVQEEIPLASIDECPLDIRVMVQRKRGSQEWHVTGRAVKVAEDYFINIGAKDIITLNQAFLGKDQEKGSKYIRKAIHGLYRLFRSILLLIF
ncbi:YheC/YheD family protein [Neobacillus drentensis]|uniref:YheC/YheD family protein n=1 Tax=Neobacillus drentensis TaxID=220684 RepID=UPI002FFE05B7